ncbi:MAG: AI-2E family transporter, partial [Spirochaetales bacterium]
DSVVKLFNIDWANTLMPILRSVSASAIEIAKNAVVTILLAVFLLLERHTLVPKMAAASQNKNNPEKASLMLDRINRQVSKYLGTKFILSLITGILFYLIALFTKLDLAFLWGVLAVLLNFIPTFGSIIITALTILMAVVQFLPNWTPIIIVAVGTIAVQMIVGNIIDPRVQGNQLNLSPFVILVSLSIFGYVWGIVGMFLAVPIISILQIAFANMDSTRGIAIMMSSGSSLKRRMKAENRGRKEKEYDDVLFPQGKTT